MVLKRWMRHHGELGETSLACRDQERFYLYTEHHNLIFIFDPLELLLDLGASGVRKVIRWAVPLIIYNYVCMKIRGDDNVWDDILGR